MRLAIIGAGWAGLSAAVQAADLGHDVTVFEASHTLGGRARAVTSPRLKTRIDNGQHIMLGAYESTLALMQRLGIDLEYTLQRENLTFESADGSFRLQLPKLPAPLHLLAALLGAKGLFWRDKWQLLRAMRNLQARDWQIEPDISVDDWLNEQHQTTRVRALFWQPLCVAALNTPLAQASAQLFANVLRDSIGSTPRACDVVLSRVDLSSLWPEQVEQLKWSDGAGHISIRRGKVVIRLGLEAPADPETPSDGQGCVRVNDDIFDAVILACNVPSTRRLLDQLPASAEQRSAANELLDMLMAFEYVPIATVTLQLATVWQLPRSMYQLHEDRKAGHYGQWLFNCPAFMHAHDQHTGLTQDGKTDKHTALVHVVISDAAEALSKGEADLVKAIEAQLRTQTRRFGTMPAVVGYELIAEKRATFLARPGLKRPGARTPWPQVWLAGDWTDTGYPAVLEGAVRSGQAAARTLHAALDTP